MPGMYVFPGGVVDPADANLKWYEHFTAFGLDNDRLASLIPKTVLRPQIFQSKENELPKEISLRITAIRETFEECGILICKRDKDGGAYSGWADHVSIPKNELQTWQIKIHNDATEFLNLCQNLECYPDLWALNEWRNWMTPTTGYKKRFNTVMYLACMPHVPPTKYETIEIEDLKWDTPKTFSSENITLPPPQQIEIAEMIKIKNIDNLLDIAVERNKKGVQLYLPVCVRTKDGNIYVLPGDTMYPKEVNLLESLVIDKSNITMEECAKISPIKNRVEFHDTRVIFLYNVNGEDNRVVFSGPGRLRKM